LSAVEDLLGEFLEVCGRLDDNYDVDRQTFDSDELRRLATQQLWIDLGETARRYCLASGLGSNAEPWSDVIRPYARRDHQRPQRR
jgi:hypothetical protein